MVIINIFKNLIKRFLQILLEFTLYIQLTDPYESCMK